MTEIKRKYSWIPDHPDWRDHCFADYIAEQPILEHLPPSVDLMATIPLEPVNQSSLGSCTGNSIAKNKQFVNIKMGLPDKSLPARLAIYYDERKTEGTIKQDAGAMIRDGFKVLANIGAASESLCPYNIAKFKNKPSAKYYREAAKHKAIQYLRINNTNLAELKSCIAEGYPFVFGFSVYESFESNEVAKTGIAPLPAKNEKLLGGHAVLAVGFDDAMQRFKILNSWGKWGDNGFFTLPYEYLTNPNLADDFWTLRACS